MRIGINLNDIFVHNIYFCIIFDFIKQTETMDIPKKHQLICPDCGQIIDMRDLSQVFAHEPCDGIPKDYDKIEQITYSGSQRIGEPIVWTKDKQSITLN